MEATVCAGQLGMSPIEMGSHRSALNDGLPRGRLTADQHSQRKAPQQITQHSPEAPSKKDFKGGAVGEFICGDRLDRGQCEGSREILI